jgi:hypothetical protein
MTIVVIVVITEIVVIMKIVVIGGGADKLLANSGQIKIRKATEQIFEQKEARTI